MPETATRSEDTMSDRPSAPTLPVTSKLAFVDALRGWAILGVIAIHVMQYSQGLPGMFVKHLEEGARGVQLFFIASAFTLFLSLAAREKREKALVRNFFIRRFFRIAPLFYVGAAFYLTTLGFGPRTWAPHGIKWGYVVSTLLFMHGWHPYSFTSVVPGGWSIAVEMNFYLLVPWLFRKIKNLRSAWLWFIGSLLIGWLFRVAVRHIYANFAPLPSNFLENLFLPSQLPVFFLGIVLYHAYVKIQHNGIAALLKDENRLKWGSWLLALTVLLCFLFVDRSYPIVSNSVVYGGIFVLFALSLYLNPNKFFVNRFTQYIGVISFSGYITHFMFLDLANPSKVHFTPIPHLPTIASYLLYFVGITGLTVLVSTVTYRFIEVPFQNLGKKIIRNMA